MPKHPWRYNKVYEIKGDGGVLSIFLEYYFPEKIEPGYVYVASFRITLLNYTPVSLIYRGVLINIIEVRLEPTLKGIHVEDTPIIWNGKLLLSPKEQNLEDGRLCSSIEFTIYLDEKLLRDFAGEEKIMVHINCYVVIKITYLSWLGFSYEEVHEIPISLSTLIYSFKRVVE